MLVRQDLSPSQQAVQACHACLECGKSNPWSGDHPHLVLLGVPNEETLATWSAKLRERFTNLVEFREPDLANSLTAVAIPGVTGKLRSVFSTLSLVQLGELKMNKHVQAKWGWYPCAYELYRKLKRLNLLAFEARRRDAAWERWNRKLPHNRVIWRHHKGGLKEKIGPMLEPVCAPIDLKMMDAIYADYRSARYPVENENQVKNLMLTEVQIDALLADLEKWYAGQSQKMAS